MRNRLRRAGAVLPVALLGVLAAAATASAAPPGGSTGTATYTVNTNNVGVNWTLYADNGASGSFVTGPGTPPSGAGSFGFDVPNGGKVTLSTSIPAGRLLSAVDAVSYATYRDSSSTMPPNLAPSLNLEICANGLVGGTCEGYTTLVWEPVYAYGTAANANNPVETGQWQTWDALGHTSTSYAGGWWSTHAIGGVCADNCFVSLATITAANPNAVILSLGVNVGHGPAGTFVGATDALGLGFTGGGTTVFDFEPATPTNAQCKNGGWTTFSTPGSPPAPMFTNQGACVSYFAANTHGRAR